MLYWIIGVGVLILITGAVIWVEKTIVGGRVVFER